MQFEIMHCANQVADLTLVYRRDEFSFDMMPPQRRNFASVLVDDLNLEADESGRVVSVWGLCPHTRWKEEKLAPPIAEFGAIFLVPNNALSRGVSIQLNANKYFPTYADQSSGWVQIRGRTIPTSAVRIFSGVIVEISEQREFSSLWLKPNEELR